MAFKDSLAQMNHPSRPNGCRVCALIGDLPEPDSSDLAAAARRYSGVPLKSVVEALTLEGYPDMHNAMRHHRYICPNG
jgi:hypothetical protein